MLLAIMNPDEFYDFCFSFISVASLTSFNKHSMLLYNNFPIHSKIRKHFHRRKICFYSILNTDNDARYYIIYFIMCICCGNNINSSENEVKYVLQLTFNTFYYAVVFMFLCQMRKHHSRD